MPPDSADTLVFCDVDGVLNVCTRDPAGHGAVILSDRNVASALQIQEKSAPAMDPCVARVLSTYARRGSLVCSDKTMLCEAAVGRLAKLLQAAFDSSGSGACQVVLSSTWRLPEHAAGVAALEGMLSGELGRPFKFDERTTPCLDSCPVDRLKLIGNFLASYWQGRVGQLRVLVLDDFNMTPLNGSWNVGSVTMDDEDEVARYLKMRATVGRPRSAMKDVSVHLVHTYEAWKLASEPDKNLETASEASIGEVQVGCGLTIPKCSQAFDFLGAGGADL